MSEKADEEFAKFEAINKIIADACKLAMAEHGADWETIVQHLRFNADWIETNKVK